jgi:hypothetical protein
LRPSALPAPPPHPLPPPPTPQLKYNNLKLQEDITLLKEESGLLQHTVLGLLVFAPPVLANIIATLERHGEGVHVLQGLQRLLAAAAGADSFTQQDMLRNIEVRGQQQGRKVMWVCTIGPGLSL